MPTSNPATFNLHSPGPIGDVTPDTVRATELSVYEFRTDDSNYSRMRVYEDATGIHFASEAAGTGTARDFTFNRSLFGGYTNDTKPIFGVNGNSGFGAFSGQNPSVLQNGAQIVEWFGFGTYYRDSSMQTGYVDAGIGRSSANTMRATGGYNSPNSTGTLRFKFPTSAAGLESGEWYDNAGTLTKVP